mmetsp:Transcript_13875/g.18194  ORF Transcript_13875/g.18194 Transcript_13875/m.18194 type:complete len:84 (-) Transcript_13875:1663-1914(-)
MFRYLYKLKSENFCHGCQKTMLFSHNDIGLVCRLLLSRLALFNPWKPQHSPLQSFNKQFRHLVFELSDNVCSVSWIELNESIA